MAMTPVTMLPAVTHFSITSNTLAFLCRWVNAISDSCREGSHVLSYEAPVRNGFKRIGPAQQLSYLDLRVVRASSTNERGRSGSWFNLLLDFFGAGQLPSAPFAKLYRDLERFIRRERANVID